MGTSGSEGNTAAGARKTYCSPDRNALQTCMLGLSDAPACLEHACRALRALSSNVRAVARTYEKYQVKVDFLLDLRRRVRKGTLPAKPEHRAGHPDRPAGSEALRALRAR